MNDAALGCLIESRDQLANLFSVRFGRATGFFLKRTQSRTRAAVLAGASK